MERIAFAVDGSEASLRAARGLAGILGWCKPTEIDVLTVQPESFIVNDLVPQTLRERAEGRVREEGTRALTTAEAVLQGAAARCSTTVEFGDPATVIAETAETLGCALIAMGSHGAGALHSLLTGSVTTKVIHVGSRPVLVIPSERPLRGSAYGPPQRAVRILVPVDGSAGATAALREVVRIASWFLEAPEVHLLAVYERTPLSVEIAAMVAAEAMNEYQQKRFEAAFASARDALAGTGIVAIEHTAIGPPAEEIRATVESLRCDLVCLGTRGTGAVRNVFLGSTTAKVLRAVDVPVLVVPPAPA
jgi:nucleotide-binding universal stress UspA family protein